MAQKYQKIVKGISAQNELDPNLGLRDTRTNGQKFKDFMMTDGGFIIAIMVGLIISLEAGLALMGIKSFGITIWLLTLFPVLKMVSNRILVLPFKKPKSSGELDINQQHPGTGEPLPAEGISFYGNDSATQDQIWFADSDVRTHCLIFGTTGAGKTEALLSICMNSLIHSSGFIYVDGKGDNSLFMKVFSMVRRMGREDDLLLINYMTGTVDTTKKTFDKLSNTMNPFSSGSADSLTELIVSLLPGGGDGMWKGRAAIFMSSLMKVLVALRDERKIMLDIDAIRRYFSFDKLEELVMRDDILEIHKAGLTEYLWNLPGYVKPDPSKPNEKIEQEFGVYEQHGFITMQYTESFGMLSDTYGHIMKTQLAEVDFFDVVVNRRFLVVLLPALEKSQQSLGNLGKIIVSSVKGMMSMALGSKVEGAKRDVVDAKPTNSPSPYATVFDEYGYYAVEGAAVMPAQARSLGFAMIFAGQDYQAFKKGSAEEAASIVANCAIKICMKLEDPTETCDIFTKAAGEATISTSGGMQLNKDSSISGYVDSGNANATTKARINPRDLKAQTAGEGHILFGDTFVRAKMFFANPTTIDFQRINKFLKVPMPEYNEIQRLTLGYNRINKAFYKFTSENASQHIEALQGFLNDIDEDCNSMITSYKFAEGFDLQTRAVFALYSHIKKIKVIDNQLVHDIEAINKLHEVQNDFAFDEDDDTIEDDDDSQFNTSFDSSFEEDDDDMFSASPRPTESNSVRDRERSSVSEKIEKRNLTSNNSNVDLLRKKIQDKHKDFENFVNNKYNPYKEMKMDVHGLQVDMKSIEQQLAHNFKKKGLIDENDDVLEDSYSDMATENIIANIGLSTTYPGEVPIKKRAQNTKIISGIINDIILTDISDD